MEIYHVDGFCWDAVGAMRYTDPGQVKPPDADSLKRDVLAENLFDAQALIVFRQAIQTTGRTGLEMTAELINVLNVLGWLVDLEPAQARLLENICSGATFPVTELSAAGAFELPDEPKRKDKHHATPDLFGGGYPPYEPPNPTPLRKPIPEQAEADAAHFYSAKEEGPPYHTKK